MPKFSLQIQEHEEFGYNGIIIKTDRNYFQPTTGIGVAHDILEHPTSPHQNGYIDEFLAIGSFLAGRIKYGWMNEFGRQSNEKDIIADVESLASNSLHFDDDLCPEVCTNYLQDDELMEQIKEYVVSGLLNAVNEYEEGSYTELPEKYNFNVDSIVSWICKGYQLFNKRFYKTDLYDVSNYLFNQITKVCDNWIKTSDEGETANLYVNFKTFDVRLEVNY